MTGLLSGPVVQRYERPPCTAVPSQVDFKGYKEWLDGQFSHDHASSMLNLSVQFGDLLQDPSRLLTLPVSRRPYVMRALSNLAKFTGQYEGWQRALRANRISWGGKPAIEVFKTIIDEEGVEERSDEWLTEAVLKLPSRYGLVLVFQRLTGLRIGEACMALTLLVKGSEKGYYDSELMVLRHFQYPELFLRKSKNVFISFLSPRLTETVAKHGSPVTTEGIHMAFVHSRVKERTTTLRKAFATQLRQAGIPRESIDLLQGRIPRSVFSQHYYRPALKALREQVLNTLQPLEERLLATYC